MNKKILFVVGITLVLSFNLFSIAIRATTDTTGGIVTNDYFNGYPFANPITTTGSGTLSTIGVNIYTVASTGNIRVAIYSDSAGTPDSLLCQSGSVSILAFGGGWKDMDVSSCALSISASTNYWLALQSDTSGDHFYISYESAYQNTFGYGSFPSSWGGSTAGERVNMRMTYTGAAAVSVTTFMSWLNQLTNWVVVVK